MQSRYYPGTDIADDTRFMKIRLPPTLPFILYAVKLDNAYYRVVHDNQKRMCGVVIPLNIYQVFKDCLDFVCFKSNGQGGVLT